VAEFSSRQIELVKENFGARQFAGDPAVGRQIGGAA